MIRLMICALVLSLGSSCGSSDAELPAAAEVRAATAPPVAQERIPAAAPAGAPERVSFSTEDGVTIVGTLRRAPVRGAAAVVLVHQLSSNRDEWAPVVDGLSAAPGLTTLSIDLRGHGESVVGPEGALDWQSFSPDDYRAMAKDVAGAVAYLRREQRATPSRISVVGSSIGSTAALLAAAADPSIAAVAVVSPGRAYRGIDAITPASQLEERPLLAIAAQGEAAAVQSAQDMARVAGVGRYLASRGSTHGVGQFAEDQATLQALVAFLRQPLAEAQPELPETRAAGEVRP